MKRKFLISLLVFLNILLFMGFLGAESPEDFLERELSEEIDFDVERGLLTFTSFDSIAVIKDTFGEEYIYKNLKPADENTNAFIKLNKEGYIEELDLTANKYTTIYVNGVNVPLKEGFRAVFKGEELEIIAPSGSSSLNDFPKTPKTFFGATPKEIIYKVEDGELKLGAYLIEKGEVRYSLESSEFYIPKGTKAVLNNFYVNAYDLDVVLDRNIKIDWWGKKITAEGKGFDIGFNSDVSFFQSEEVPIYLANSKNGKYFAVGDSGSDVEEIQRIIGFSGRGVTGVYDKATLEVVKKWQGDKGLVDDGLFGKDSLSKSYGTYFFDLSEARNNKYFRKGDTGDSVREIQRFLISNNYLSKTYVNNAGNAINSDDGIFGFRTQAALENWQKNNGLVDDGLFGKESLKTAKSFGNNVVVSMNGGSSIIKNTRKGLNIVLEGDTALKIGNKHYSFDGEKVSQGVLSFLESANVETPTKVTFKTDKGDFEVIQLKPGTSDIGILQLKEAAARLGIDPRYSVCAGFVTATCPIVLEEEGGGLNMNVLTNKWIQKLVNKEGVYGSAWEMQQNMLDKGGEIVFSKEDFLTPDQILELNNIEKEVLFRYNKYKTETDLNEYQINKRLSNEFRGSLGKILNKDDLSSQVVSLKGDVVSFYYSNSNYLGEAIIEGKNSQKNTHVGMITGSVEDEFSIVSSKNLGEQIRKNLGKVNEEGLYVNSYLYSEKDSDFLKTMYFNEGSFYNEEGNLLSSQDVGKVLVQRPQVAHMIHYYAGEKDPYHLESLDKVVSRSDIALYGVTRPPSSEYIGSIFAFPDFVNNKYDNLDCSSVDCVGFDLKDILRTNQVSDSTIFGEVIISSSLERQKEFGIPKDQLPYFVGVTNAIIKRESNFGDSEFYKLEKLFPYPFSTLGYMEVSMEQVEEFSDYFEEKTPSKKEMFTVENSVKYGQRFLAKIFRIYVPEEEVLTTQQVEIIASAYNSGPYTPRNAALQKQLQELGYISRDIRLTGNIGPATTKALTDFVGDYNIEGDSADYVAMMKDQPERFEDTDLYNLIKQEYLKETGEDPEYAIIPNIQTKDYRGTRTIQDYAEFISKNYKNFCPTC